MTIIWSPAALGDLSSIHDFIAEDNPDAAQRVVETIYLYAEEQLSMPRTGRPGRVAGTYELVIPKLPYIVPYRLVEGRVEIARVYHTSRLWPDLL